jgi:hypothetical protein
LAQPDAFGLRAHPGERGCVDDHAVAHDGPRGQCADSSLQSATESPPVSFVYGFMFKLAGAALLSWLLNWARTYVVARLAEHVTSRMRRETFEHLQRLSLTYFNRKRTGDLISRIGSDTDHISLFLSVNFIEFVVDVLQFILLAAVLFYIHPLLALGGHGAGADCGLAGRQGAGPSARRLCGGEPGVERHEQCPLRYHSRRARGEGLRSGAARDRAIPRDGQTHFRHQ